MGAQEHKKIFIGPEEGARLPVLDIVHKLTAEVSSGSLTIEEWGLPPGVMIPPHTHTREDECNFVLEGELTCDVGGEIVLAPVGSYLLKPRNCAPRLVQHGHRAGTGPGDPHAGRVRGLLRRVRADRVEACVEGDR
jgi:quercetin dioxygenase-like cupin family protein